MTFFLPSLILESYSSCFCLFSFSIRSRSRSASVLGFSSLAAASSFAAAAPLGWPDGGGSSPARRPLNPRRPTLRYRPSRQAFLASAAGSSESLAPVAGLSPEGLSSFFGGSFLSSLGGSFFSGSGPGSGLQLGLGNQAFVEPRRDHDVPAHARGSGLVGGLLLGFLLVLLLLSLVAFCSGDLTEAQHVFDTFGRAAQDFSFVGEQHHLLVVGNDVEAVLSQRDLGLPVLGQLVLDAQIGSQPGRLAADVDDLQIVQRSLQFVELLTVELLIRSERLGNQPLPLEDLDRTELPLVVFGIEPDVDQGPLLNHAAGFVNGIIVERDLADIEGVQLEQILLDPIAELGRELVGVHDRRDKPDPDRGCARSARLSGWCRTCRG